jgi:hypothetical protein
MPVLERGGLWNGITFHSFRSYWWTFLYAHTL